MKSLLITISLLFAMSMNVLFNGYPSEAVSIVIGIICLIIGMFIAGKGVLDEKNY